MRALKTCAHKEQLEEQTKFSLKRKVLTSECPRALRGVTGSKGLETKAEFTPNCRTQNKGNRLICQTPSILSPYGLFIPKLSRLNMLGTKNRIKSKF